MSEKKPTKQTPMKPKRPLQPEQHSEVMEVLTQLQQKVLSSAALNGGFDTLIFKMNGIEEKQSQLVSTVDSIHEAIYHPDDGLFARVKSMEYVKGKVEAVSKLEKDVYALQQWYTTRERDIVKEDKVDEEQEKLVDLHTEKLKELEEFRQRVNSVVKWLSVTLGGAFIALLGKLIYTLVTGHIVVKLGLLVV